MESSSQPNREVKGSICGPIDILNEEVSGTRILYEVLCEFLHPNVGTIWSVANTTGYETNRYGVKFQTRELSIGKSNNINIMKLDGGLFSIIENTLLTLSKLLKYRTSVFDETEQIKKEVLSLIQLIVRDNVGVYKNIFQRNDECPCGSGVKVKQCCGR
ncbi:MAG: SEC-C domain-containing protein [Deltaproteobacteria bacterium]|nr:SEC-C domain-containing protein [Deltaproteobacteria bacterium]